MVENSIIEMLLSEEAPSFVSLRSYFSGSYAGNPKGVMVYKAFEHILHHNSFLRR